MSKREKEEGTSLLGLWASFEVNRAVSGGLGGWFGLVLDVFYIGAVVNQVGTPQRPPERSGFPS